MPIVGLMGAGGAGRSTAAQALQLLGYEPVSFANRLRHVISMATGLPEQVMRDAPDEPFERPITLQAFHVDGMCRIASATVTIPDESPKKMREKAGRTQLQTPREVMEYVRHELFELCVSPSFWVDYFKAHYAPDKDSHLVIDDVGTAPERKFVASLGGVVVGVERDGLVAELGECDLVIQNDGSPEQLQDRLVAALFSHMRGIPMQLDGAPAPAVPAPRNDSVAKERDSLQHQLDELTKRHNKDIAARDKELARLNSEKGQLEQQLARQTAEAANLHQQMTTAEPKPAPVPQTNGPATNPDQTETAALAARLALALGLEAGLGKDPRGQGMICIDLPAGRVSWPIADGLDPMLPRYDKAPTQLDPADQRAILLDPQVKVQVSTEQALEREGSDLAPVSGVLKDLILLAEGCKIHRAYRAKQAPKGDCPTCWTMWEATERLRGMSSTYGEQE